MSVSIKLLHVYWMTSVHILQDMIIISYHVDKGIGGCQKLRL